MNPITATRRYELDMGHCLPNHDGKCHRPHGHRYVVEATVATDRVVMGPTGESDEAMVADFGVLKQAMAQVLDRYDHRFVMAGGDPRVAAAKEAFGLDAVIVVSRPPTAEYLAMWWGAELRTWLTDDLHVVSMVVWETPNARAEWSVA